MEEYERLLERLLREVGGPRKMVAASYQRLWHGQPVQQPAAPADADENQRPATDHVDERRGRQAPP